MMQQILNYRWTGKRKFIACVLFMSYSLILALVFMLKYEATFGSFAGVATVIGAISGGLRFFFTANVGEHEARRDGVPNGS